MCGICGFVNFKEKVSPSARDIIFKMSESIKHRGPDEEGYFTDDHAALGHRRLSIIDLAKGQQPMSTEDGLYTIVYNGEVYNFHSLKERLQQKRVRFSTNSDTEVILKSYREYSESCLNEFNGMFSLAIWNKNEQTLFLARDRFGKKPLYYTQWQDIFIFASELKAILEHPLIKREIDFVSLSKYLAYDYVPCPRTIFKGINKLEPGHYLIVQKDGIKKRCYWDILYSRVDIPQNRKQIKLNLISLLKQSVKKRLISDVPLGVFLSGGVDSSAIVAMMAELMPAKDIKTYSIGFREKGYDESSDARIVAKLFNTDHHEEIIGALDMLAVLDKVVDTIDEPFSDSSIIPTYIISRLARRYVKVALGGDGGDELFFGYPTFKAFKYSGLYTGLPQFAKSAAHFIAKNMPLTKGYLPPKFLLNKLLRGFDYPLETRLHAWIGNFIPHEQIGLLKQQVDLGADDIYSEDFEFMKSVEDKSLLNKISYLYIKSYLEGDILVKVDRASMANSLEVRAPFLDTELANFVFSLNENYKLQGLTTKYILKETLKGLLPNSILHKRKHGFAIPLSDWFRNELKNTLLEIFSDARIKEQGIFDYDTINNMIKQHDSGGRDNSRGLWSLFVFQRWFDKWAQ